LATLIPSASPGDVYVRIRRPGLHGQPFGQVFRSALLRGIRESIDLHSTTAVGGATEHASLAKRKRGEPVGGPTSAASFLDPYVRQAAHLAPPAAAATVEPPSSTLVEMRAHASLEELLPAVARRVGWSNDGRRGAVRIEVGVGRLAGATLVVMTDGGRVSVDMDMPNSVEVAGWPERIAERLKSRGLDVERIDVR